MPHNELNYLSHLDKFSKYCNSMARVPDCLSGGCGFESRQYCYVRIDCDLDLSGKITVVVYSLWKREVIGSNPISQTTAPFV